jgi:hypothetical protein
LPFDDEYLFVPMAETIGVLAARGGRLHLRYAWQPSSPMIALDVRMDGSSENLHLWLRTSERQYDLLGASDSGQTWRTVYFPASQPEFEIIAENPIGQTQALLFRHPRPAGRLTPWSEAMLRHWRLPIGLACLLIVLSTVRSFRSTQAMATR